MGVVVNVTNRLLDPREKKRGAPLKLDALARK
jgi:hypothetical protein